MVKEMVIIKWVDAKFYPDTYSEQQILEHKMGIFESLGYLIERERDDKTTIIASECNDRGDYRGITLIPSGSVISVHKLVVSSSV